MIISLCVIEGSADGGRTAYTVDEEFNQKMIEAAKILNLKGHIVGIKRKALVYSAGDIEGNLFSFRRSLSLSLVMCVSLQIQIT
jgi:hypothetical protein